MMIHYRRTQPPSGNDSYASGYHFLLEFTYLFVYYNREIARYSETASATTSAALFVYCIIDIRVTCGIIKHRVHDGAFDHHRMPAPLVTWLSINIYAHTHNNNPSR